MPTALQLRLTPEQNEKKGAMESEVTDLEEALKLEEDEAKKAGLTADLDKKKLDLVALLDGFEVKIWTPCEMGIAWICASAGWRGKVRVWAGGRGVGGECLSLCLCRQF